ncbi:ion transporter [Cesiribacter andamanensis]|uniref:MlotiK1 channel protein n=1 Tax=Cesiribacter andamanensis AMV16 TaxID=1279009 RepID=M7N941_9BACT|nr:ion transporter [Cesiribacter andamanensis]EMR03726.1 MlotiK1 channel protein [Cesiribacter andamanensis AMV16]
MTRKSRLTALKQSLRIVIFGTHTPAGRAFDVILLVLILLSILTVILESVAAIRADYGQELMLIEWFFTICFTIEYVARIFSSQRPLHYIFSFYGLVDLLAILPTYLNLVYSGARFLLVIRGLRLLRIFRVLKLTRYLGEAQTLQVALRRSVYKIIVFIGAVLVVVIIVGAIMYMIEGPENGYTDIPTSIYWAIVTITTVGFGDITPLTPAGKFMATILMLLGYGIIAVPTGIVSAELTRAEREGPSRPPRMVRCTRCRPEDHPEDAHFCRFCGLELHRPDLPAQAPESLKKS